MGVMRMGANQMTQIACGAYAINLMMTGGCIEGQPRARSECSK